MTNNFPLISQLEIPIRWVDLDAYGHVNNAKYFDYMSEIRATLFKNYFTENEIHFVVVETQCFYKKSFHHPNTILLTQHLKELGNTYMVFYYGFYLANDPNKALHAECTTKIVCLDANTQRIIRIPTALKAFMHDGK